MTMTFLKVNQKPFNHIQLWSKTRESNHGSEIPFKNQILDSFQGLLIELKCEKVLNYCAALSEGGINFQHPIVLC
jgi:hypothetical protein